MTAPDRPDETARLLAREWLNDRIKRWPEYARHAQTVCDELDWAYRELDSTRAALARLTNYGRP